MANPFFHLAAAHRQSCRAQSDPQAKGLDTVSLEAATETIGKYEAIPHPEYIADWRQSPEKLVEKHEIHRLLDEALARLDEKHRLVFLLRDVEGLSVKETAEALGLSEANTKVRLLRARSAIARIADACVWRSGIAHRTCASPP